MLKANHRNNVFHMLHLREIGHNIKSFYGLGLKIMKEIVCDKNTEYKKIWDAYKSSPITYEGGKIYMDNYRTCYTLYGNLERPTILYENEQQNAIYGKTKDALIFNNAVLDFKTDNPLSYKKFFMSLTGYNWLITVDVESSKTFQKVYLGLPTDITFAHLSFAKREDSVVAVSTLYPKLNKRLETELIDDNSRTIVIMALFKIRPVEFVALFKISAAIFGKDCRNCDVMEDMLFTTSVKSRIRIYNFKKMVEENIIFTAKLNERCPNYNNICVGDYPDGLPVNCLIRKAPPLLFDINCNDSILHFGGYPYHYILGQPGNDGNFEVKSLETDEIVKNGTFELEEETVSYYETQNHFMAFHPDESGRIVHTSLHDISIYKLAKDKQENTILVKTNEYRMIAPLKNNVITEKPQSQRNSLVRSLKTPSYIEDLLHKTILCSDYEDELDLYSVLGYPSDMSDQIGRIQLYNNVTGELKKVINLKMRLNEFSDYTIILNLDVIIVMEESGMGKHTCSVYKIDRNPENMVSSKKKKLFWNP